MFMIMIVRIFYANIESAVMNDGFANKGGQTRLSAFPVSLHT